MSILEPYELATRTFRGGKYCMMSFLPSLAKGHTKGLQDETAGSRAAAACHKTVLKYLQEKFSLKSMSPLSLPVLCATMDPQICALSSLEEDNKAAVKQKFLQLLLDLKNSPINIPLSYNTRQYWLL